MLGGYYYTLSAIAQSFAAIVSLYAVFVIYKLQLLRNQRTELTNRLKDLKLKDIRRGVPYNIPDTVHRLRVTTMSEKDLLNWAENPSGVIDEITAMAEVTSNEIRTVDEFQKVIIYLFKRTLIINGTTIAFSLLFLPWKNFLYDFLQLLILIIVLCLSLTALVVTMRTIWITIKG